MISYNKIIVNSCFKNRTQLNKIGIILTILLFPLFLNAQITIEEYKPIEKTPKWLPLKDKILMPYDSTSLEIQQYPILDAYKKYIGQTLFLVRGNAGSVLLLSKEEIEIKDKDVINQYYASQRRERNENREKREIIINRNNEIHQRILQKKEQWYRSKEGRKFMFDSKETEARFNKLIADELKELEEVENMFIENPENYIYNLFFEIKNKYFEIIDVINITDEEYKKRFDAILKLSIGKGLNYEYCKYYCGNPCHLYYDGECIALENIPVFVLREKDTGHILYSTCRYIPRFSFSGANMFSDQDNLKSTSDFSSPFILVGGFTKLKKELVGQTILKINPERYFDTKTRSVKDGFEIKKKWTCVDVSVADEQTRKNLDFDERKKGNNQEVTLVLQSENDSPKEYLAYNYFGKYSEDSFLKPKSSDTYYITEKQHLKDIQEKEKNEQEKQREEEQKLAEERQKREEKINNRKNELTTEFGARTAENIMAGKFVVGMSKKACKETMQSLTNQVVSLGIPNAYMSRVVSSTATSEVWETYLQGLFGDKTDGPFEYLYFNGDKLVKINVIKSVFR